MKATPPSHQSSVAARVICGVAALLGTLALALRVNHWARTGVAAWGPTLTMSGLIVLMTTGAFNVPRGPLRWCLSAGGVLSIACGSLMVFIQ
jgi:hypothetical protein